MLRMGRGVNAGLGTVMLMGQEHTKFGDPAAGGNLVFVRGSYEF